MVNNIIFFRIIRIVNIPINNMNIINDRTVNIFNIVKISQFDYRAVSDTDITSRSVKIEKDNNNT